MGKTANTSVRFDTKHMQHAFVKLGVDKPQVMVDRLLAQLYAADHPEENVFTGPFSPSENPFTLNRQEILQRIREVEGEECPKYAKSALARNIWRKEQLDNIHALREILKKHK